MVCGKMCLRQEYFVLSFLILGVLEDLEMVGFSIFLAMSKFWRQGYHIFAYLKGSFMRHPLLLQILLHALSDLLQRLIRLQTIGMRMVLDQVLFLIVVILSRFHALVKSLQ
jgi:hypothetical protein